MNEQKKQKAIFFILVLLFAIIFVLLAWRLGFLSALKLVFSFIFVFFLPGFVWSFVFFKDNSLINIAVRIVFSFAFSIITVPLIEFYANNLFHIKINTINNFIEISSFIFLGLIIYLIILLKNKKILTILFIFAILFLPKQNALAATMVPLDYSNIKIIKISGDNQTIDFGDNFSNLKTRVIDENGNPVAGEEVIFTFYNQEGKQIGDLYATISDKDGYAIFEPKAKETGNYIVEAKIKNGSNTKFNLKIVKEKFGGLNMKSLWWLLLLIPFIFFLFLFSRRKKHLVLDYNSNEGIAQASIEAVYLNQNKYFKRTSNNKGKFSLPLSRGGYLIKISKDNYELSDLENHPELKKTRDGYYFQVDDYKESLHFIMKK